MVGGPDLRRAAALRCAAGRSRVGALDGLPAAVRSAANERRLDRDVAMLLARRPCPTTSERWLDSCLLVRAQLAPGAGHGATRTASSRRRPSCSVFDPAAYGSEGRVALAVGDVDTADNVAFLVPGLGSEVRGALAALTGNALRVTAERGAPRRARRRPRWPGWATTHRVSRDAVLDGAADEGADLLVADVLAVQAARDVVPHLTVVGHSYGSTTAGTALRDRETGTDDVVLVGSPGRTSTGAAQLHLPAGHVFVGASSRDPVSYVDRFGTDPAHAAFGAIRFRAEDPTRNSWRLDFDDHSKYFDPAPSRWPTSWTS